MKRELKKEQTRSRIKEAALTLFSEQGYDATTVEAIAKLAGVAKGTFFNYFGTKDDLVCDLQGLFVLTEAEKLQDSPGPLVPRLQLLVFGLVSRFELNKPLTRAMFQAMLASEGALDNHNRLFADLKTVLLPLIVQAQENGEIRKDMPADMLAQQAFQTYFGTMVVWSMEADGEPLNARMTMSFELFFKGIAPQ